MNFLTIAIRFLKWRLLATFLTVVSILIGVGTSVVIIIATSSFHQGMMDGIDAPPLLIGPKGSPYQFVLNTLFFIDQPLGTVDFKVFEEISKDDSVLKAIPVAMPGNFQEFKIIGTTKDYFRFSKRYRLEEGKYFERDTGGIVIGQEVKKKLGLKIGDKIPISEMCDSSGTKSCLIVGILSSTGTPVDRTLFVSPEFVWSMHAHHAEPNSPRKITAILVYPKNQQYIFGLEEKYNSSPDLQIVIPVSILDKLFQIFRGAEKVLKVLMFLILSATGITVFLSMYASINEHRRDIGLMRAIGAKKSVLTSIIFFESILVSGIGIISGWIFGRIFSIPFLEMIQSRFGFYFSIPAFTLREGFLVGSSILLFSVIGLIPVFSTYGAELWQEIYFPQKGIFSQLTAKTKVKIKMTLFVLLVLLLGILPSVSINNKAFKSIDEDSLKIFRLLRTWDDDKGPPSELIQNLDGKEMEVTGFMMPPIGPSMGMESFFIFDRNPNLPRCPFCYTAPPRINEMIKVIPDRKDIDYTAYPVRIKGLFEVGKEPDGKNSEFLYRLKMKEFEVMVF